MGLKMGGIICDSCRVVICDPFTEKYRKAVQITNGVHTPILDQDVVSCRRTKKGSIIHFCSDKCREKMDAGLEKSTPKVAAGR